MKEKKLIAFDLYNTCFAFTVPQEQLSYKQLFSNLEIINKKKELQEALLTSCRTIEEILDDIAPEARKDNYIDTYYEDLHNEIASVQLFPETKGVLETLRRSGYQTAAISNLAQPYIQVLNNLLPHTFDYEILSCNVGTIKPDQKIFNCLKKISGYHEDEIAMVGDSRSSDIQGAFDANIDAIHIDRSSRGIQRHQNYLSISTLDQLLDIL